MGVTTMKQFIWVCDVEYAELVEEHACVARNEQEFKNMIRNLLYCEEEQIRNVRKMQGVR